VREGQQRVIREEDRVGLYNNLKGMKKESGVEEGYRL